MRKKKKKKKNNRKKGKNHSNNHLREITKQKNKEKEKKGKIRGKMETKKEKEKNRGQFGRHAPIGYFPFWQDFPRRLIVLRGGVLPSLVLGPTDQTYSDFFLLLIDLYADHLFICIL